MKTEISTRTLAQAGWNHSASDWYFYSPTWGSDTHIHLGGSSRNGAIQIEFISLKVKDKFAGRIYGDFEGTNWGLLEDPHRIPYDVAIEFREALNGVGIV
jgi:hypothetical protein